MILACNREWTKGYVYAAKQRRPVKTALPYPLGATQTTRAHVSRKTGEVDGPKPRAANGYGATWVASCADLPRLGGDGDELGEALGQSAGLPLQGVALALVHQTLMGGSGDGIDHVGHTTRP